MTLDDWAKGGLRESAPRGILMAGAEDWHYYSADETGQGEHGSSAAIYDSGTRFTIISLPRQYNGT